MATLMRPQVPRAITTWPKDGIRRASINNFGMKNASPTLIPY